MKLFDAWICLDCEEIFVLETVEFIDQKVQLDYCPHCGSSAKVRLCKWVPTMRSLEKQLERQGVSA